MPELPRDEEATAELELVSALRRGDPGAPAAFEARYLAPLERSLARMRLPAETLDEVKQIVRAKLLVAEGADPPRIEAYAGQGRLRALVQVVATRAAISLLRKTHRAAPGGGDDDLLELAAPGVDPELRLLQERARAAFRAAFEEAVRSLSSRERNLLRLHLLGGVTLEQLAAMYGVHRATVVRWLAQARERVLTATREALGARLGARPDEIDSLMGLAASRFDLSVERLLRTMEEPAHDNPEGGDSDAG